MVHFKSLFLLSLLFAAVILISSTASARKPDVAQTQGGTQADHWHGGEGGGWYGGGGGGGWHEGGGGGWHGGHGDETHQAQTETNSADKHVPLKP